MALLLFLLSNGALNSPAQNARPLAQAKVESAHDPPVAAKPPPGDVKAKPSATAAELQRESIRQQRAGVRKQAEALGLWLAPLDDRPRLGEAAPPACAPLEDETVNPLIAGAAKAQGIEPKLLRAVIEQESGFLPCAVSVKGAQGLMQLMPETAAELGVADAFDPRQNVEGGARYLKQLMDKYKGDLSQALGAYNAGPKAVDESGGVPDLEETREYVDAILRKAGLKQAEPAKAAEPATKPGGVP